VFIARETVTPEVHDGCMFESASFDPGIHDAVESLAPLPSRSSPLSLGGGPGSTSLRTVDDERLEAELCQLAADLSAGMARWFDLIAAYDNRRVWEQWECRSMPYWLAAHVGVSLVTARQYVHVAHKVQAFPLLKAEFAAGRLSYSRVRAICRCVTPETEEAMVSMAQHATAPQLERFAAGVDRVRKRARLGDDTLQHEARFLQFVQEDDGTWMVRGRLPADVGTAWKRAVDAEMDHERDAASSSNASAMPAPEQPGLIDPVDQRRVDAMDALVTRGYAAPRVNPAKKQRGRVLRSAKLRPLLVIHRYPDGNELEGGPTVSDETVKRLAKDADVLEAVHSGGSSCAGHKPSEACDSCEPRITYRKPRRTPTATMRRVLLERDQGCRFKGCGGKGHLHAHHVVEYQDGGLTTSINLIMLCGFHHRAVHRNNWVITGDPKGELTFTREGLAPPRIKPFDIERLIANVSGPISPKLYGDRFSLNYIVSVFLDAQDYEARQHATIEHEM
jgi:Domain of unknown function (DUF222)